MGQSKIFVTKASYFIDKCQTIISNLTSTDGVSPSLGVISKGNSSFVCEGVRIILNAFFFNLVSFFLISFF